MLKSLKAAGGDAYAQMIAVLDASVSAVEKSGIFSEIGGGVSPPAGGSSGMPAFFSMASSAATSSGVSLLLSIKWRPVWMNLSLP